MSPITHHTTHRHQQQSNSSTSNMTPNSPLYSIQLSREGSPLTRVPLHEVTPDGVCTSPASPLLTSLLGCIMSSGTFTQQVIEQHIPMENNPCPLSAQMGDNAEYWVDQSSDILHLKFPAKLDFNGQSCQLGLYFSLPDSGVKKHTIIRHL